MDTQHRYFVQYMLKKGISSLEAAMNFCQAISQGSITNMDQLKMLVVTINREISKQFFKISFVTCELTNEEVLIWINTKNDEISKLQLTFSPIQLEYFHVIMNEILSSDSFYLTYPFVINLTSTLTSVFTRSGGEECLQKWIEGGYFVKQVDKVYMGPRLIVEFLSYLKSVKPNQTCQLCMEICFVGKTCSSCDGKFHAYCITKYLRTQSQCPSCRTEWANETNANNQ